MLLKFLCKTAVNRVGFSIVLITAFIACNNAKPDPEITVADLKESVEYLASDSLKGRKAGEHGDKLAAQFIYDSFKKAGLKMPDGFGYQYFGLITSAKPGPANLLNINGKDVEVEQGFLPYAFSANASEKAEVVFAGYGLDVNQDTIQWNDYAGLNTEDKWVMVLKGDPDLENRNSGFVPFSNPRAKTLTASDKNAAGIIFVAGSDYSSEDKLEGMSFDKNNSRYSIPVIQITRAVANEILAGTGETIELLEAKIKEENTTVSLKTNSIVYAETDVVLTEAETQNVLALLPGNNDSLKNEYIVIGAHYDHLGMGGTGSGTRSPDSIAVHYGADDNASGVAAIIELAEKLASEKNNKRSVIFAAFGAEEMGLVGSKEFVANSPVELESVVGMFNFDMVGRLDTITNGLSIGGTKTALETEDVLNSLNPGFELAFSSEGVGPSDHASFYLQDIPVFFISTGAHADYHTPNDVAGAINYNGLKKVTEYASSLVMEIANRDSVLTFQEAGPKYQRSRGGRFKVTFGIMPDFAGLEKRGMRIDAVTKGKPADKAGMQKGDIITAIEGKKVGNIYDYMNRLQVLEASQTISVDIIRGEKETVLIVQL